jgi:hypothetical protein
MLSPQLQLVGVVILLLVVGIPFLLVCRAGDRLISFQYFHYHAEWVKDGMAWGMFWKPPGSKWADRPFFQAWWFRFRWTFTNPGWAEKDERAVRLFRQFRWLNVLSLIAVPLGGLIAMVLAYFYGGSC